MPQRDRRAYVLKSKTPGLRNELHLPGKGVQALARGFRIARQEHRPHSGARQQSLVRWRIVAREVGEEFLGIAPWVAAPANRQAEKRRRVARKPVSLSLIHI